MSVHYNNDFKKEVVRSYMEGDKSIVEIAAEYNIAKNTVSEWARKYGEEFQSTSTLPKFSAYDTKPNHPLWVLAKMNQEQLLPFPPNYRALHTASCLDSFYWQTNDVR